MELKVAHNISDRDRTEDIKVEENVSFEDLHLSDTVLCGLHASGFLHPSPIQLQAIPLGRCGLDLIVQAKSGTGKTCVFSVIALEMISVVAKSTQVLVVAPTREIAVQISQVMLSIGSAMPDLRISTFIGGTDLAEDKAKLKCCHIAIGTPGRLNHLIAINILNLSNIRLLVLDEADQLLTGQFKEGILPLIKSLPSHKQILTLSATYPDEVTDFLYKFMRTPTSVRLNKDSPALLGVTQFVKLIGDYAQVHKRHKAKQTELLSILSKVSFNQCLIFLNSQLRAESLCNQLRYHGWKAACLTGKLPQQERLKAFDDLCTYRCRILVSTDLSARGIDSEHVNLVINLDVPVDQATYLHRVGRAGRFGSKGGAISIVCEGEEWETMRAVATLTNVRVYMMSENWTTGINLPDDGLVEQLQLLSENECAVWIEKQNEKKSDTKQRETSTAFTNMHETEKVKHNLYRSKSSVTTNANKNDRNMYHSKTSDLPKKSKTANKNSFITMSQEIKKLYEKYVSTYSTVSFSNKDILTKCLSEWESISEYDTSIIELNGVYGDEAINEKLIENYLIHIDSDVAKKFKDSSAVQMIDTKGALLKVIEGRNPLEEQMGQKVKQKYDGKRDLYSNESGYSEIVRNGGVTETGIESRGSLSQKSSSEYANFESTSNHENISNVDSLKKTEKETKESIYCKNTGFGIWQPVESKHESEKVNVRIDGMRLGNGTNNESGNDSYYSYTESGNDNHVYNTEYNRKDSLYYDKDYYNVSKKYREILPQYAYHGASYSRNNASQFHKQMRPRSRHMGCCHDCNTTSETAYYIHSAQKFASMVEYVSCIGKMSAQIARDHNKRLQRDKK